MKNATLNDQVAFQGGPTVSALQNVDSPWHVPADYVGGYLQAAKLLDYKEMARAAELLTSPGSARSYRDTARMAAGLGFTEADPKQGWPASVSTDYDGVAWVLHCQLVERLVPSARSRETSAALAAHRQALVCMACGEGLRVADFGDTAGLCSACVTVLGYVKAQRAAELAAQKVGGKLTGKTRGQLVAAYMDSQAESAWVF